MAEQELPPITGWASAAMHIRAQAARIAALEADSHPPIDLTPVMDEILDTRGYAPRDELRNPPGGKIPSSEGRARSAAPMTGDSPVGAAATTFAAGLRKLAFPLDYLEIASREMANGRPINGGDIEILDDLLDGLRALQGRANV